jgi:signal transduction histidine kinase
MGECEVCGRRAVELAQTGRRIWLGCPRCHRTWNVGAEDYHDAAGDVAAQKVHESQAPMSFIRGYLIAVLTVVLALILRMLLRPLLGDASPFLLFTPAVAISALYGGIGPGVLATALSTSFGSHFFLRSTGELVIEKWDRLILFAVVGAVITTSSALLRRSRRQLSASLWREQKARAMAEAADQAKDEFLALVSHELRNPMNVVLGWIAALRRDRLSPAESQHAIDAIERNASMCNRLVDDVLDRSRIATDTLRLDPQVISLDTAVRAAVDQMRGKIEAAGLDLHVAISGDDTMIVGDSIRLQQVFTNLLSNAIKFTPRGGGVSVATTVAQGKARVTVTDTGSGITAEFLPHVFDAFRQDRHTLQHSSRGLGLGLSISRYLVERHGGTITATSEGRGRGSVFTVLLPLAAHREARVRSAPRVALDVTHIGTIH